MSWVNAIMTNKGVALLSKLTQGNTLKITSAKTGAGTVSTSLLASQTNVTTPKQTLAIQSVGYPQEGKCAISVDLTNDDVSASYTVTQVGIFAQDPDEGEVLFCITQADSGEGTTIPSATVMPGYNAQWTFYLQYGQADSVEVTVDPANTVTQAGMEQYVGAVVQSVEQQIADSSVTTGGTGAAYTATVPGIAALTAGKNFIMIPHTVSTTTTPTLNVNDLGAKGIRRRLSNISTSPQQGYSESWLAVGKPFRVMYDGSYWIVEGMSKPSDSDTYGTKKAENVSFDNESTGMTAETVQAALEEVFTFASDGKKLLAETVTGLGVDTSEDDTWKTISDNMKEAYLDTSDATATAADMANDVSAYVKGEKITGSLFELPAGQKLYGNNSPSLSWMTDGKVETLGTYGTAGSGDGGIVRPGCLFGVRVPAEQYGDAAATDVVSGKSFTSAAGLKTNGSVSETKSGGTYSVAGDSQSSGNFTVDGASVAHWTFRAPVTANKMLRSGSYIQTRYQKSNFGDATAADVVKGKKFTSSAGFNITGTAPKVETCTVKITSTVDITSIGYTGLNADGEMQTTVKTNPTNETFSGTVVRNTIVTIRHSATRCELERPGTGLVANADGIVALSITAEEGGIAEINLTPGS